MLKILLILFLASCKSCNGIEITRLRHFGERVRNLSIELLYHTEEQNGGQVAMAPFTVWNLFSLFAFETSGGSWGGIDSVVGIPRWEGQYFNKIFKYITNLLVQLRPGRMYRSRHVVFYDSGLRLSRGFQRRIANAGALLKKLNFKQNDLTAKLANDYIQLTNDSFIPKKIVFDKSDFEDTSMIVSGVVEFSGAWSLPFNESNTVLEDGYFGEVYMMHQRAKVRCAEINSLGASALELPYGDDEEYSMVIIRPLEHVSIQDVLRNFDKIKFLDVILQLYSEGLKEMDVKLPKFSITSSLSLDGPLMAMEGSGTFSQGREFFSEATTNNMYVTAEHRAVVMVGEAGTVATASTPGNMTEDTDTFGLGSAPPFLYFIVHGPSMSIIFCGKYGD